MSDFDFSFDAAEVPEDSGPKREFKPIPVGDYSGLITKVEWKETKSGIEALNLTLQVVDSERYDRRIVFDMICLLHPKARDIAMKSLKSLSKSCFGKTAGSKVSLKTKEDYVTVFKDKTCLFRVKHEEFNGKTDAKVHYYKDREDDDSVVAANIRMKDESFTPVTEEDVPF